MIEQDGEIRDGGVLRPWFARAVSSQLGSRWKSNWIGWCRRLGVRLMAPLVRFATLTHITDKFDRLPRSKRLLIAVSGIPGSGTLGRLVPCPGLNADMNLSQAKRRSRPESARA